MRRPDAVAEASEGTTRANLGCFLSGGTDSSTISGMASEMLGGGVRTFSIGFDVQAYDESYYYRLAAKHFKTDHTEFVLNPSHAGDPPVVSLDEALAMAARSWLDRPAPLKELDAERLFCLSDLLAYCTGRHAKLDRRRGNAAMAPEGLECFDGT